MFLTNAGSAGQGGGALCGHAPSATAALTVNGDKVSSGAFPWHAAIYLKKSDSQYDYVCGGSLITNSVVVSGRWVGSVRQKQLKENFTLNSLRTNLFIIRTDLFVLKTKSNPHNTMVKFCSYYEQITIVFVL